MSLALVHTRSLTGISALAVTVEVHVSSGLPSLCIVGLPEAAVKESRDRVRSAIINSGFEFPSRRLTINLAPADLPKEGGRFDLPIALGILAASGQLDTDSLKDYEFIGELSLGGELQSVRGVLPSILEARKKQRMAVIPDKNIEEASLIQGVVIYHAKHLLEVTQHLTSGDTLRPLERVLTEDEKVSYSVDMSEVKGQTHARRALEIAAAGQHSLLFIGPPGTGKSMLAERLPTIMPPMTEQEALEAAVVQSLIGNPLNGISRKIRHFRSPHHTASSVALVGGGSNPRPGEISLAHHGVLFLDELPEFDRRVLDSLREPLETGHIIISRAARQAEFPANVQLIAAMNPCPCGYLGDSQHACSDTPDQIQRYRSRVTGPFLDRIDICIHVPRIKPGEAARQQNQQPESSDTIRQRVIQARQKQLVRAGVANAKLKPSQMKESCNISTDDENLLLNAAEKLGLSSRAHDRILRVARTIADLDNSDGIKTHHMTEAVGYRRFQ